jgi:splicing factor 1
MKVKLVKTVNTPFETKSNILGGEIGHRKYDCPQTRNFNAGVHCHRCGQAGHFARDCKAQLSAGGQGYGGGTAANNGDLQKEMEDFMAEIGAAGTSVGYGQSAGRIESGQPNPWQQPQQSQPVAASVAPWVIPLPPSFWYMN